MLNLSGKRQAVEDYVAAASIVVRDAWQFATSFERNNNLIVDAKTELGWSDEDVDSMFRLGATLQPVSI